MSKYQYYEFIAVGRPLTAVSRRPIPPGMANQSAARSEFAKILELDAALIKAASTGSPSAPPPFDIAIVVRTADPSQKDRSLIDMLTGEHPLTLARVRHALQGESVQPKDTVPARSVRPLREDWGVLDAKQTQDEAAKRQ